MRWCRVSPYHIYIHVCTSDDGTSSLYHTYIHTCMYQRWWDIESPHITYIYIHVCTCDDGTSSLPISDVLLYLRSLLAIDTYSNCTSSRLWNESNISLVMSVLSMTWSGSEWGIMAATDIIADIGVRRRHKSLNNRNNFGYSPSNACFRNVFSGNPKKICWGSEV